MTDRIAKIFIGILISLIVALLALAAKASAEPVFKVADHPAYTGSTLVNNINNTPAIDTTQLTDAAPTREQTIDTRGVSKLIVDVISDKGMRVTITRLPDHSNRLRIGAVYPSIVVSDGGGAEYGWVDVVGCPAVKITSTKTESGSSDSYFLSVRGASL